MSRCVRLDKRYNKITISQISEKEFLLECNSKWARFGCQIDPSIITSAHLDNGPHLIVGDSFLGEGKIAFIQNIDNDKDGHIILKITLY